MRVKKAILTDEDQEEESLPDKKVKWKLGDQIGKGTYAHVFQCLNVETGELLAVKRFTLTDVMPSDVEAMLEKLKKEVRLLKALSHPNIVRYIATDIAPEGDFVDILMEFVAGGSIRSLIKRYSGLDEAVIRKYAEQTLHGLVYLHENRVIHRDLKGANILLTPEGAIKLTDFGSAGRLEALSDDDVCRSMKGSPYWMAPEVVRCEGHTTKADIWSFGCVLLEMKTGVPPWSNISKETRAVLQLIATDNSKCHAGVPMIPNSCSEKLRNLVSLCITRDPKQRPNAKVLLDHPFFRDS